jgi:signal transduction histidine kinase
MGNFEPGKLTTNASVEFGLPVRDERGELKRVFFASLDLNLIAQAASSVKLPADAIATVMDNEGTVLARTENAEEWVGKSISDKELGKNVMWSTNRTFMAKGLDGVRRFYSSVTLSDGEHPAMHVLVGVPSAVLFDKPNTGLAMSLLLLAVVTAGAMGASNAFAERAILKPVENLIEGAEQIAMGDLSVRTTVPTETAELHQLSETFNRMAAQLAAREEALKHATNEIVQLNQGLEQKVKDRTAELRAINQELEAFTYSISHDLRAPLRHIDGFAQLLHENQYERLDEKGRRHLKVVSSSAKKMGALIDELLVFSRMARQELLNSEINLNDTVQEAMAAVINPNEDRQIQWEVSELPVVRGDAAMMRQVWVNLLSNAVKYTSKRERASIEVNYRVEKGEFIFYVRDNGAGFDMKYADKLFGVFQRLHTDKEFEGTGIGLANVRQIVTRHGGRTWAESKVDEGSTFYFSWPSA